MTVHIDKLNDYYAIGLEANKKWLFVPTREDVQELLNTKFKHEFRKYGTLTTEVDQTLAQYLTQHLDVSKKETSL